MEFTTDSTKLKESKFHFVAVPTPVYPDHTADLPFIREAAGTKWNFLKFYPGLVGGHCIGVDPYYLTYKAGQIITASYILSGRRINDGMGKYIAETLVKQLIKADKPFKVALVAILGFMFKENCFDTRNA